MADTIVSQETNELKTGDTEATLAWLDELRKNLSTEPTKKRPPAPDRNRAATANNARAAATTKRAAQTSKLTTDEWLKTLPKTGKQHWEHRALKGATGVSILIADGDITIYTHANERGILDAMGIHRAPEHTKWFAVETVYGFEVFCCYWMQMRMGARYALPAPSKPKIIEKSVPKPGCHFLITRDYCMPDLRQRAPASEPAPKAEEKPATAKLAMKVWHREGDKYVLCQCFGWVGSDLRIQYPHDKEPVNISAIRLVELLGSGKLRIEGVMPDTFTRVPARPLDTAGIAAEIRRAVEAKQFPARLSHDLLLTLSDGYVLLWRRKNGKTDKTYKRIGHIQTGVANDDKLLRAIQELAAA